MGEPHSPLDPPKRPSHQPPSPVGGGTHADAGDPVPEACLDLLLLVPRQGWAGLRIRSATDLLREVCRSLWNRNLLCSTVLWPLLLQNLPCVPFTDVLWIVGSELCVCAFFYSAILAPPPGSPFLIDFLSGHNLLVFLVLLVFFFLIFPPSLI